MSRLLKIRFRAVVATGVLALGCFCALGPARLVAVVPSSTAQVTKPAPNWCVTPGVAWYTKTGKVIGITKKKITVQGRSGHSQSGEAFVMLTNRHPGAVIYFTRPNQPGTIERGACPRPIQDVVAQDCPPYQPMSAEALLARTSFAAGLIDNWWTSTEPNQLRSRVDLMAAQGSTVARVDVLWPMFEPQKGKFNWRQLDFYLARLTKCGMTPLLTVYRTPGWINDHPGESEGDFAWVEDPTGNSQFITAQYANFVGVLAARYNGSTVVKSGRQGRLILPLVQLYEVWNEPNGGFFLRPQWKCASADPATCINSAGQLYFNLFTAAAAVIRGTNPSAKVGGPSLFSGSTEINADGSGSTGAREFLGTLANLAAASPASAKPDFYSLHLYPPQRLIQPNKRNKRARLLRCHTPELVVADARCSDVKHWFKPNTLPPAGQPLPFPSLVSLVPEVIPALDTWAGPLPVMVTETGYTVGHDPLIRKDVPRLPPQVQAALFNIVADELAKAPRMAVVVYSDLQGNSRWDSGLFSPTGEERPIANVYRVMAANHR